MRAAEAYILDRPEPFRTILIFLKERIEAIPGVELKFRWNIPFYFHHGNPFCYLNHSKDYIDLGFWQARELNGLSLTWDQRKMIGSLRYRTLEEIDVEFLELVLDRATAVSLERKPEQG